jgi:4,5-dihydroxyphthalate decarboxylase
MSYNERKKNPGSFRGEIMKLTFASGLYDRMQALYTKQVQPQGIELDFIINENPRDIFNRTSGRQEFDVSEMSCSDYIARLSVQREKTPFIALPVYPARCFRHGYITINKRRGIAAPKDLARKRIGLPRYTMTATVWIRGILEHEYGVDLSDVEWVEGQINDNGQHGEPGVMPLMRRVNITVNKSGKSLSQLIDEDSLDAIIGTSLPESRRHNPNIVRLFPDFRKLEADYYRRTKHFPIMHCIVIRRSIYEEQPWAAASLYNAFCEAKAMAIKKMHYIAIPRYMLPWMHDDLEEIEAVFGGDPFKYGVEAGRHNFEAFMQYMTEHGIIREPLQVDDLFGDVGQTNLT